jgi:hypothetical protein
MPGLVPGIHAFFLLPRLRWPDICAKTRFALLPGRDDEDSSRCHAASVFSTSLIQYEVPYRIASSLKS